ncbi:hypothetical protein BCF46_2053 [Litoreibacter meonggei]|uniref:Uncharacterized protein n=1 Tax=Litoreibacter meonggei TaxID=1049199 RepID=A0A497WFE2_9RHOB|nr:hypothetical protein [Litoreibacter meonggei]RLJ51828.1 hypothetical protein BCF46_2053 [Litoreibacter meonggei]
MTKFGVCITSAKRRLCVGQVAGPLWVVFLAASGAQAGAWEEFETRCLVPMENVALVQPDDLRHDKKFKNDGDTYSTYRIGDVKLAISDGRANQPKWCRVTLRGEQARELMDAGFEWSARAQADERYNLIGEPVLGFVVRSTQWREPKIDVSLSMQMKGGQFTLRVEETDLES